MMGYELFLEEIKDDRLIPLTPSFSQVSLVDSDAIYKALQDNITPRPLRLNNKIEGILFYFKYKYNMSFKDLKIFRKYFKVAFMIDETANDKFTNFKVLDNIAKSYRVVTADYTEFDELINSSKDNSFTTFIYNPRTVLVFDLV